MSPTSASQIAVVQGPTPGIVSSMDRNRSPFTRSPPRTNQSARSILSKTSVSTALISRVISQKVLLFRRDSPEWITTHPAVNSSLCRDLALLQVQEDPRASANAD